MTILELANELGVKKEKIKYLQRQLPKHMYMMIENRVYLSDAAVDAIKNKLSGGELTSDIPVIPFNALAPEGWGNIEGIGKNSENGELNGDFTDKSGDLSNSIGETRLKSGDDENGESGEANLTFIDLYKTQLTVLKGIVKEKDEQIKVKDSQIETKDEQIAAKDRQIEAKDEQMKALFDTIAAQNAEIARLSEWQSKTLAERENAAQTANESVENSDGGKKRRFLWWTW